MKAPSAAAAVSFARALQRLSQLNTSGGRGGGRPRPGPGERAGEKVKLFPGSFLPAPPVDPPGEWLSSAYLVVPTYSVPVPARLASSPRPFKHLVTLEGGSSGFY